MGISAPDAIGRETMNMNRTHKHTIRNITSVLRAYNFTGATLYSLSYDSTHYELIIRLPHKVESEALQNCLDNIRQEVHCDSYKIAKESGKVYTILFSKPLLDRVTFKNSMISHHTQKIILPSSYGNITIDFEDGASCHMLAGGAPRMGKTFSLLYLATLLYVQNKGNVDVFILSQKGRDFYPFDNVRNAQVIAEESEIEGTLEKLIHAYKQRDQLLYSLPKATDSKSVKKLYPDAYKSFRPIYIFIDEYADYIGMKEIQDKVFELVRKAGYLNIHVILCTQRPEARFTVPANIKMGLMLRLCLPVTDTNNSVVVLDEEGGEKLPRIQGRAIIKDGESNIVQMPYMSYTRCERLLLPYKRSVSHETIESSERPNDKELSTKIQSMFEESTLHDDLQSEQQPNKRMQSNDEKTGQGWFLLTHPTVKG